MNPNQSGKPAGHIDCWWLDLVGQEGKPCLAGFITSHHTLEGTRERLRMTSPLVRLNREQGWAETMFTFYTLGKEVVEQCDAIALARLLRP